MIGIIYQNLDKKIIAIINDVQSYTADSVTGKESSIKGIDLTAADFCIIESTDLTVGDTLVDYTDIRGSLPPTPEQKIALLEQGIAELSILIAMSGGGAGV